MGKYLKENHTEMSLHSVHRLRFNRFIKNLQMNIQWALKRHRRNSAVISMSTLVSIQSTCLKYASKFHGLVKWSLHFTLTLTISLYIPLEPPPPLTLLLFHAGKCNQITNCLKAFKPFCSSYDIQLLSTLHWKAGFRERAQFILSYILNTCIK